MIVLKSSKLRSEIRSVTKLLRVFLAILFFKSKKDLEIWKWLTKIFHHPIRWLGDWIPYMDRHRMESKHSKQNRATCHYGSLLVVFSLLPLLQSQIPTCWFIGRFYHKNTLWVSSLTKSKIKLVATFSTRFSFLLISFLIPLPRSLKLNQFLSKPRGSNWRNWSSMGNALGFLYKNCLEPTVAGDSESLGPHGVSQATVGVSVLAQDIFYFNINSQACFTMAIVRFLQLILDFDFFLFSMRMNKNLTWQFEWIGSDFELSRQMS